VVPTSKRCVLRQVIRRGLAKVAAVVPTSKRCVLRQVIRRGLAKGGRRQRGLLSNGCCRRGRRRNRPRLNGLVLVSTCELGRVSALCYPTDFHQI